MHAVVMWFVGTIGRMGYLGIIILMTLESSLFPVPSELVVPPAGYLAAQGQMNVWLIILCGTLGSLLGALCNYALAYYLGRPWILKYGRYFLLPPDKFAKVERFFIKHGEISTFTGRLVIVVRHLISLPAGLARMSLKRFCLFTLLGSSLWVAVLTWIGYFVGNNPELMRLYYKEVCVALAIGMGLILAGYIFWQKKAL